MKRSKSKIETLVFSLAFAAYLLSPLSLCAQGGRSDEFFRSDIGNYENRDDVDWLVFGLIANESFSTPLGSGVLVMAVAGLAYAIKKRRKPRSDVFITGIVAFSVFLGLVQCRKKPNEVIPYNNKEVRITLKVDGGAKTNVNPVTGDVTFEDGDEIIVANNGVYVGKLTYEDGLFSGTIVDPSSDDYLHFYHLGNAELEDLTPGVSSGCTVSIADQINGLPVISYGRSAIKFSSEVTSYSAMLRNRCALAKFNVTTLSSFAATCVSGFKNTVAVDFSSASFSYGMENDGKITLAPGSGERWAILLPQDALGAGDDGSAFSGRYVGYRAAVPEIHANNHIDDGIEVVINTLTQPEGALNGVFAVNGEGKQVVFSKANLSYVIADGEWRFLDEQYTYVEVSGQISANYADRELVTLFGWGTSGYNHGAVCYEPYLTDGNYENYYAYGDANCNLYDHDGRADWGYNIITNGGGANKQWRTMNNDEWYYIMHDRPDASTKYARLTINKTKGYVIFPDVWDWSVSDQYDLVYGSSSTWKANKLTYEQWQVMEDAGAVFITSSGSRANTNVMYQGSSSDVWSSSAFRDYAAYSERFDYYGLYLGDVRGQHVGIAVRLVCE